MAQLTNTVVMISPDQFGFNTETAVTNTFQIRPQNVDFSQIRNKAMEEFSEMSIVLRREEIRVLVLSSRKDVVTPDAVFPNNWFSTHENGLVVLYPMLTPNRRAERQVGALQTLLQSQGFKVNNIFDLTQSEKKGDILEGTGSMVLEREKKVAFTMMSPRTTKKTFLSFCQKLQYKPVFFHAYDKTSVSVYHTNVLMSIGDAFAVICLDSIKDRKEKEQVIKELNLLKKEIIEISLEQMYAFCGNILQLISVKGKRKIVLSLSAFNAFTKNQKTHLSNYGELIPVTIPTIEKIGGGSARCMLAEIFLLS